MIEFRCDTCGETVLSLTGLRHHAELRHPRKAPQGPTGIATLTPLPGRSYGRLGLVE